MFENKMTLPVLIIGVTLVIMTAFQMRQLVAERTMLEQAIAQQDQPLKQAAQVTKQFENLAVGTQKLANAGNDTATKIVADFDKLGLKINIDAPAGQSPVERKPAPVAPMAPMAPSAQTTTASEPATTPAPAAVGQ